MLWEDILPPAPAAAAGSAASSAPAGEGRQEEDEEEEERAEVLVLLRRLAQGLMRVEPGRRLPAAHVRAEAESALAGLERRRRQRRRPLAGVRA